MPDVTNQKPRPASGEYQRAKDSAKFSLSLTKRVEGAMSEAWMLELISAVRDVARANAMHRLAEHLDDAMLVAASEYHVADVMPENRAGHDGTCSEAAGVPAGARFH